MSMLIKQTKTSKDRNVRKGAEPKTESVTRDKSGKESSALSLPPLSAEQFKFKTLNSYDSRAMESLKMKNSYPNTIPVICPFT